MAVCLARSVFPLNRTLCCKAQPSTAVVSHRYTREAGVRALDRKLGAICRAVAVKVAEGQHKEAKPDRAEVGEGEGVYLGHALFKRELLMWSLGS